MTLSSIKPAPGATVRADYVEVLARGLAILSAFERDSALGNADLVALTGLPKATVSRLVGTLVSLGFLQHDADSRKYVIGVRVLGLGASLQRHMRIQRAARPRLQQLAHALDLSVVLGTREGDRILLLEVLRPPTSRLRVNSDAGSHVPLATTAMGMACLVALPLRERVKLIEELRRQHTQDWKGLRERMERAHTERTRTRFVVSLQSRIGTIGAAACPLQVARRVFVVAAVGPAFELPRERLLLNVGPALADMVDLIALDLGGSAADAGSPARVGRQPKS